jgi:hypothetical protein
MHVSCQYLRAVSAGHASNLNLTPTSVFTMAVPSSLLIVPLFKIPVIASVVGLHFETFTPPQASQGGRKLNGVFDRTILRNIAFETWVQKVRVS